MTREEIKLLAECERKMDDGYPFVLLGHERIMCKQECLDEFGLVIGQSINSAIFHEILKWNIADIEAKITEQKLTNPPEAVSEADVMRRPSGSNADEWLLFLMEHLDNQDKDSLTFMAVQIAEAIDARKAKQELFDLGSGLAVRFNPEGRFHGWLFRRHPGGGYVSVQKLPLIAAGDLTNPLEGKP